MDFTCLLVAGVLSRRPYSSKQAKWGRQQLQPSCQPHQSATNGTACSVGTGTHTYWLQPNTPVSILLLSYENLYTNFIFLWLLFFFYLQLFIAEKNLSSFGAFESFSNAFFKIKSKWWLTIAAFLRSSKVLRTWIYYVTTNQTAMNVYL